LKSKLLTAVDQGQLDDGHCADGQNYASGGRAICELLFEVLAGDGFEIVEAGGACEDSATVRSNSAIEVLSWISRSISAIY
jgi:hypothetical protein